MNENKEKKSRTKFLGNKDRLVQIKDLDLANQNERINVKDRRHRGIQEKLKPTMILVKLKNGINLE